MFYCATHDEPIADLLWQTMDPDFSTGCSRLREPWAYWLKGALWYRPKHWLNFNQHRTDARTERMLREHFAAVKPR
jgi:hypothetical protein